MFQRTVAALEQKKRNLTSQSLLLRNQLAHASAQRDSLRRKVRQRVDEETGGGARGGKRKPLLSRKPRSDEPATPRTPSTSAASAVPAPPASAPPPATAAAPSKPAASPPTTQPTARAQTALREPPTQTGPPLPARVAPPPAIVARQMEAAAQRLRQSVVPPQRTMRQRLLGARRPRPPRPEGPEATTRSMQAAVLALGGLLLGGAAIVLAVDAFSTIGTAARLTLLAIVTAGTLAMPLVLARRGLTATAETVAAVALLLVLLDGWVIRAEDLFGVQAISATVYSGLVCAATAAIAAAYSVQSHLLAPRYATLAALQPVLPLLAYDWILGPAGWSLALSGVALANLGFVVLLARSGPVHPPVVVDDEDEDNRLPVLSTVDKSVIPAVEGSPEEDPSRNQLADELMRDLAWVLFAVAFGASCAFAVVALATTNTLAETLRAAAVVLIAAAIGVTGSLSWRRGPLPDVASGVATLAVIAAFARVGAMALPGRSLLFFAGAVALAAGGVALLPKDARRGPRWAGSAAAAAAALLLAVASVPAILAPIGAVWPVWGADTSRYAATVADAAGPNSWQFVLAALLITLAGALLATSEQREDVLVVGLAFTALVTPTALGLSWTLTPAVVVLAAIAAGVVALTVREARTAWLCLLSATVLGIYAVLTSLAEPGATAVTLSAIAIAGGVIAAMPRSTRSQPSAELVVRRVTDAATGGALFALPGAVAAGTAVFVIGNDNAVTAILIMSFLALAISLGSAAYTQVVRREQSVPVLVGATAGAAVVFIATLAAGGAAFDIVVASLMLGSALMLWLAPKMDDQRTFGTTITGADAAAAAVTVAAIVAVGRAVSLVVAGGELVTIALLVFAVAIAARSLREEVRRGPVAGGAIVGGLAGIYAGVLALAGAIGVVQAANPLWTAPLETWRQRAAEPYAFGWEVPIALLLLAGAAAVALPQPFGDDAASAAVALTAMAAPVGLNLGWTSPMILGWVAATGIGVWAAYSRSARAAYTRLTFAALAGAFAAAASLIRPGATAGTLVALAISAAAIAVLAAMVAARRLGQPEPPAVTPARYIAPSAATALDDTPAARHAHLTLVGGTAVTAGLLALTGAGAAIGAALHRNDAITVLTGALAATSLGLAIAGAACRRTPGYLPYVTAGVAGGATITVLAALPAQRSIAVVYAAAAALLGVLAELLRADQREAGATWRPARGFRPDRTSAPSRAWRRVTSPSGLNATLAFAAGIPAAIVVVFVAPALVAALFGPYRWVMAPWTATPETASDLGAFERFDGTGMHVLAAALLTIAGALLAAGPGGRGADVASRSVGIIVPGVAITLLIAPVALDLAWPAQPTAALLVATLAGLGLALTDPAPDGPEGAPLRAARRLVFVIAVLAAAAGGTGSLATQTQTLVWLGGSIVVGIVGALFGRAEFARSVGWQVAASTALGFALAAGLAADLTLQQCAFGVLVVAALLMLAAAAVPHLRNLGPFAPHRPVDAVDRTAQDERIRASAAREALTIEAVGYGGAVVAILLTLGSGEHTAAVLTALGAILGLSAARSGRSGQQRAYLIIAASISMLIAIWLLLSIGDVALPEAYTLPFALLALVTGLIEIKRRPQLGSWVAYGPALVAGFLPSLAIVLTTDSVGMRRVLLILGAVVTVAIGALRRQKAPVVVGSVVTVIAAFRELLLIGLPWPILLLLFTGTGVLLVSLGATYEQRRRLERLRGAYRGMR